MDCIWGGAGWGFILAAVGREDDRMHSRCYPSLTPPPPPLPRPPPPPSTPCPPPPSQAGGSALRLLHRCCFSPFSVHLVFKKKHDRGSSNLSGGGNSSKVCGAFSADWTGSPPPRLCKHTLCTSTEGSVSGFHSPREGCFRKGAAGFANRWFNKLIASLKNRDM